MDIDGKLVKIINDELGEKSADLFVQFFHGFPHEEQIRGAKGVLTLIVGPSRTDELLKEHVIVSNKL